MGAKNPTKLKLRRPTYKCDECDKRFLSSQALKTHHYCIHKMKVKPKSKAKLVNLLGKSVRRAPVRRRKDVDDETKVSDVRKMEYECPQCSQIFPVYFSAYRHIQRTHRVNSKGESVPSNSPDIIKPLRVETCIKCQMRVRSGEAHSCAAAGAAVEDGCACAGCHQTFPTVFMFDMHLSGLHSDAVDTIFFPNLHEFTQWKEQMEEQSGVRYLVLGKCNSRQTYRCTWAPAAPTAPAPPLCCPSSIVVKEYSKSIQVNFFHQHHGHKCEYEMPERFRKYLSSVVMKQSIQGPDFDSESTDPMYKVPPSAIMPPSEREEYYMKLKNILDHVTLSACNADLGTMKQLHEKALEMRRIVKSEDSKSSKNMTDKQITDTLEAFGGKRKNETSDCNDGGRKSKKVKDVKSFNSNASTVACFNDSYKEFVDKINEKQNSAKNDKDSTPHSKPVKSYSKKKIVKTKIGQFKPSLSPKKTPELKEDEESEIELEASNISFSKVKTEVDYEVVEQENDYNILILKI